LKQTKQQTASGGEVKVEREGNRTMGLWEGLMKAT